MGWRPSRPSAGPTRRRCGPNTTITGTLAVPGQSCGLWDGTDTQVNWGRADGTDSTWTQWCGGSMGFCTGNFSAPIYCIGQ